MCLLIMGMFHMLPASTFRLFEHLLAVCIKAEKAVNTEVCSDKRITYTVLHDSECTHPS